MSPLNPYNKTPHHTAPVIFQWTHRVSEHQEVHEGTGTCPECGCVMTKRYAWGQHTQSKGGFMEPSQRVLAQSVQYVVPVYVPAHGPASQEVHVGCGARITIASWQDGTAS